MKDKGVVAILSIVNKPEFFVDKKNPASICKHNLRRFNLHRPAVTAQDSAFCHRCIELLMLRVKRCSLMMFSIFYFNIFLLQSLQPDL